MKSRKAVIIGSGVAGLASAVRLAVQGFEVTVYEKNNYPGGKINYLNLDDYHFDVGPSLFTQPENIEELFTLAGEPMTEYFNYGQISLTCRYFYEDGVVINAYSDTDKFAKELEDKTGESGILLKQYLKESEKIYKNIGTVFLNYPLRKSMLFKTPVTAAIKHLKTAYFFKSLHQFNTSSFKKPHTIQLFNRYATYNGSSPYKAPAMLNLIAHIEHNEGVFYPAGGMISITDALYKLALKKGVSFHFTTAVKNIIYNENKAIGVVANDENIYADVVVTNIDVYYAYKNLLCDERKAKKIIRQERSSSAIIFYWGIKNEFPQLHLHNILFSNDYKNEFDHLFKYKKLYNDPTIYINITSKLEPGVHAPRGKENWFVMINAPAGIYQETKEQIRQTIIKKINRILQTDIESFIEAEEIANPSTIESTTSSYLGSLYGTSSNSIKSAFFRHPNFISAAKRLYFTGGSVHPGGGISLCLKSAKIVSDQVAKDVMTWKH